MIYNTDPGTQTDSSQYYNMSTPWQGLNLDPDTVNQKTGWASYGMSPLMTYKEIQDYYNTGQEAQLRTQASARANLDNIYQTEDLYRQGKITNTQQINQLYQPSGVLEQKFGDRLVNNFTDPSEPGADEDGTWARIAKTDPLLVQAVMNVSKHNTALVTAFSSARDELMQSVSKTLGGIPSEIAEFSQLPSAYRRVFDPNKETLRQEILRLPPNEALKKINELKQFYLSSDPQGGASLFSYMLMPNKIKEGQEQFFDMLTLGTLGLAGSAKTLAKGMELSRMTGETLQRVPEILKGNISVTGRSAVGDAKGAGLQRVVDNYAEQMLKNGAISPTSDVQRGLMSVFETNLNDIYKGGPGKNGNATYNIVLDELKRNQVDFFTLAKTVAKSTGLSDVLAMENVAKATLTKAVESHPWLYSRVGNVLPIQLDEFTNRPFVDLVITNPDGSFMSSADKMIRTMEDTLGVTVNNVHGVPLTSNKTGAGVYSLKAPGIKEQAQSLEDLLAPDLNRKDFRASAALSKTDIVAGEKVGGFTPIRPANGVYSEGKGFYGTVRVGITNNMLKDAVYELPQAQTKQSLLNNLGLGKYRTPEEVLSDRIMADRKVAMFAQGIFNQHAYKTLEPTRLASAPLRGKDWYQVWANLGKNKAFNRALQNGQETQKWFKDIPDLEHYYLNAEGRLPDPVEIKGYFAYKEGYAYDLAFRNLLLTKKMEGAGVERHVLSKIGDDGSPVKSDEILGSVINKLPEDWSVRVAFQKGNGWKTKTIANLNAEELNQLMQVEIGQIKGIKLWNPELFPLEDFAGLKKRDYVEYVFTEKAETRPLGLFELPRKEGGHLEYDAKFYLKQGDFARNDQGEATHYLGDKTAMALESNAVGVKTAGHLNKIREYIKSGKPEDIAAAKQEARQLGGMEYPNIVRKFKSGEWDIDAPFHIVPQGRTVANIPGAIPKGTKDTFFGSSPANQARVAFTGERDAYDVFSMNSVGVVHNPQLAYRPAKYLDPYSSMNRSLSRVIESFYMDDVKHNSIQEWMGKYGDKLQVSKQERDSNPYQAFNQGTLDPTLSKYERRQIEAERFQIKMFHNMNSEVDSNIASIEQWLADKTFSGDNVYKRSAALLGKYSWNTAVETPAVLRSFAYRFGLGLFNPGAFFTQLNTFTNLFALGGIKAATQGTIASLLHQVSRLPNITAKHLADLDKFATRFGWKPGDWLEARQSMLDHGFHLVNAQTNTLRTAASQYPMKLFKSTAGQVFDGSSLFFDEGEKWARYGSWYTAWMENPRAFKSALDRQSILNRADLYSGNMTQASRSTLQNGFGSLPTQFLGYWMRMAEMMTGSRLTKMDKGRMFGAYALLYGMPSGLALTGVGAIVPFESWMNKAAVDHGWLPENSRISQTFFQGLTSSMLHVITGKDYAAGSKFGIGPGRGIDIFREDTSMWRIATGPVGDMIMQTMGNFEPILRAGWGVISGDSQRRHVTAEDWRKPLSVVSSLNAMQRLQYALDYHKWRTRNENVVLSNVSPTDAWMMTATGVQPEAMHRQQMMRDAGTAREDKMKRLQAQFNLDQGRYFRAMTNKEESAMKEHFTNMNVTAAQYPPDELHTLWGTAYNRNSNSLPDSMTFNYYNRKQFPDQVVPLMNTFQRDVLPIQGR